MRCSRARDRQTDREAETESLMIYNWPDGFPQQIFLLTLWDSYCNK